MLITAAFASSLAWATVTDLIDIVLHADHEDR